MSVAVGIVTELELALLDATADKRMDVLRRVTDLFVGEAEHYTSDQTALFDNVMGQLVSHIESRAAVELSKRLAPIANAPLQTVRHLADHDDIEVSGPILEKSDRLTDDDLVAIAKSKSQAHLAKIANRSRLTETVTDVLVDHGDSDVANTLAINTGAQFSKIGMAKLVMHADGDARLTETLARRDDIPAHIYGQLVAQATGAVRSKLLAAVPSRHQHEINKVISEISTQVAPKSGTMHRYTAAKQTMQPYAQDMDILKRKIFEYANVKRGAEVVVGISILSGTPAEDVDRLFHAANGFGLMALCKSLSLDWLTAGSIITLSAATSPLEELQEQFAALSVQSAQRLLRFWQGRQKVAKHVFQAHP